MSKEGREFEKFTFASGGVVWCGGVVVLWCCAPGNRFNPFLPTRKLFSRRGTVLVASNVFPPFSLSRPPVSERPRLREATALGFGLCWGESTRDRGGGGEVRWSGTASHGDGPRVLPTTSERHSRYYLAIKLAAEMGFSPGRPSTPPTFSSYRCVARRMGG